MISKFIGMEHEKQDRIIHAALEEFAHKGYKDASTNEIVKNANISKGLLFHYFENKKGLFLFLLNYSKDIFVNEFYGRLNYNETDIIKRLSQIVSLKIDLIRKYPDLYEFLLASSTDDSMEIKQEMESQYKSIFDDFYKRFMINMDISGYKEGLDINRVTEIITWVVQGFANSELEKLKNDPGYKSNFDLDAIMARFQEYMELLKSLFYK